MNTATAKSITWREIIWTDENNKIIDRFVFHVDELAEVVNLPFPKGAVVREPVYECSVLAGARFYRRDLTNVGDTFVENINQGNRDCVVVAIDREIGRVLYEYDMPNGTSALRWYQWERGRMKIGQIAYSRLSARWIKLIVEEGVGLSEMLINPQSGRWAAKKNFAKHGYVL